MRLGMIQCAGVMMGLLLAGVPALGVDFPVTIHRGNGLANTFARLEHGLPVKIVYLGGSVTQSPGWRDKVTAWFTARWPGTITEVNAGWGGTGSLIGAMRFQRDVMIHGPNLVFIEFAVNDLPEDPVSFTERNYEGMVRQGWSQNRSMDICFAETIAWYSEASYLSGNYPNPVLAHNNIGGHYGIPTVNMGWALYQQVLAGTPWTSLAPDRVHPNDAGSTIYANAVIGYLESERTRAGAVAGHLWPSPRNSFPVTGGQITEFSTVQPLPSGWTLKINQFGVPSLIESSTIGAQVNIPFTGTGAAAKVIIAAAGGNLSYRIDGGGFQPGNLPANGFDFVWALPVGKLLSNSGHTLIIRVDSGTVRLVNVEAATSSSLSPPAPPVAAFNASPLLGDDPLQVNFTNQSGGVIDWRLWDFDDGSTSTGISPVHTYTERGIYVPKLTVIGPGGTHTQALTSGINVSPAPADMGDFDGDGDTDMDDFAHLQACFSGPGNPVSGPSCDDARMDNDADVDLIDLQIFRQCLSGAGVPLVPGCHL